MPIRFPAFEGSIYERHIVSRGLNMYEEDYINQIQVTGPNEWSVEIGSERVDYVHYDVGIGINNGRVTFSDCNCPYNQGPVCKHIVAALYYIRSNNLYVEGGMEEEDSMDELEEEEEDESEEEEDHRVPRRSQRSSNSNSKSKSKKNSTSNNSIDLLELGTEGVAFLETDDVEKEFYCQVCLGIMSQPVSMACHAHSVCYDCTMLLYKHQKKENEGYKLISCPTCREGSGALKVKKSGDLKVNLELKRIKEAYLKKKRAWMKEKQALEEMLGLNKGNNNNGGDKKNELEDKKEVNKSDKNNNNMLNALNEDMMIEEEIERMDLGRLGEIAVKVLERLHANGLTGGPVLEKYKEYFEENEVKEDLVKEKVPVKVVRKVKEDVKVKEKEKTGVKREREVKSDEEVTLGRRYSLRNLKKVKKV